MRLLLFLALALALLWAPAAAEPVEGAATHDGAVVLDGGLAGGRPDFATRPVAPIALAPTTTAPAAPQPWWRNLVTAGVAVGGAALVLVIRQYTGTDPCANPIP